jgi:hypothetical protein
MSLTQPKSATEIVCRSKREAYIERHCKPSAALAGAWERDAMEVATLPTAPDVGAGGEVVRTSSLPDSHAGKLNANGFKRAVIRDTLAEGADRIAEDASIRRTDLLMQPSFDAVAMGIDTAESIQASNCIEKMLAHQMAVAHEAAMRMMDRGLSYEHSRSGDQVEACRCINAAARLMGAFNDAALTVQRLRTGGSQTVTVQHVTVTQGGQAVIGNVQAGGHKRRRGTTKNGTCHTPTGPTTLRCLCTDYRRAVSRASYA